MLARTILRSSMAVVARPPVGLRALTVKGGVFDKEAHEQEIADVSKQIEDAMSKEKSLHNESNAQVNKFHESFDSASQEVTEPDKETKQSKTEEMGAIFDEQVKLEKEQSLRGQGQSTPKSPSEKNVGYQFENEGFNAPGSTTQLGSMPTTGGMMDAVKQTLKQAMPTGDGMKGAMKQSADSLRQTGQDLKEAAKGTMKDMAEMAKNVANTPADEADKAHAKKGTGNNPTAQDEDINKLGATQAGDRETQKKNKFSNNRQNASIL